MRAPSNQAVFSALLFLVFAISKFFIGSDLDLAIIALIAGVVILIADYF